MNFQVQIINIYQIYNHEKMHVIETEIPEVKLIETVRHSDSRGFFVESFIERWFLENVAPVTFVQDNFSFSVR